MHCHAPLPHCNATGTTRARRFHNRKRTTTLRTSGACAAVSRTPLTCCQTFRSCWSLFWGARAARCTLSCRQRPLFLFYLCDMLVCCTASALSAALLSAHMRMVSATSAFSHMLDFDTASHPSILPRTIVYHIEAATFYTAALSLRTSTYRRQYLPTQKWNGRCGQYSMLPALTSTADLYKPLHSVPCVPCYSTAFVLARTQQ